MTNTPINLSLQITPDQQAMAQQLRGLTINVSAVLQTMPSGFREKIAAAVDCIDQQFWAIQQEWQRWVMRGLQEQIDKSEILKDMRVCTIGRASGMEYAHNENFPHPLYGD